LLLFCEVKNQTQNSRLTTPWAATR
jgi:hypothetical protein